jgi:hypothetical protein
MECNFLSYFQLEASAKGNIPYLLSLDLLLVNARIDRQYRAEQERAEANRHDFERSVETALHSSESLGQSAGVA